MFLFIGDIKSNEKRQKKANEINEGVVLLKCACKQALKNAGNNLKFLKATELHLCFITTLPCWWGR